MLKKEKLIKKLKYFGKTRVLRARSIYIFFLIIIIIIIIMYSTCIAPFP